MFLVLGKIVCPFLVKYFGILIWHPTSEVALDKLLDAKVDVYYSFCFALAPAGLTALILFSYSEQGLIFWKEFVLTLEQVYCKFD